MSLIPTEEEALLQQSARKFLDDKASVKAFRKLRDEASANGFDRGLWREMSEMGWAGVLVAEDRGGVGLGHRAAGVLAEEMGKTLVASPFLSSAVMAATALGTAASSESAALLPGISAGEIVVALAVDEGHKHDPAKTTLHAKPHGNGFRLNGEKSFVVDGHVADQLIVASRTSAPPTGLTLFLVDPKKKGVEIERTAMVDGRNAARVRFDNVEANGDDIVGDIDGGWSILERALNAGRAALSAELTGVAAGAFGITNQYLKDRTQFGRPIGAFQALQHRAAHLYCEIEVTASAVANAGRELDRDPGAAAGAVSLAKARAIETARLAVSEGVQMHGGVGMTDEFDIGLYMKRARVGTEWLGDYAFHAERIAELRGF